jgi:hypothetical protein
MALTIFSHKGTNQIGLELAVGDASASVKRLIAEVPIRHEARDAPDLCSPQINRIEA